MRTVARCQIVFVCRSLANGVDVLSGSFVQVDPVQIARLGNFDGGSSLVDEVFDDFAAAKGATC